MLTYDMPWFIYPVYWWYLTLDYLGLVKIISPDVAIYSLLVLICLLAWLLCLLIGRLWNALPFRIRV